MPLTEQQEKAFAGKYLTLDEVREQLGCIYKPDGSCEHEIGKRKIIAITLSGGGAAGAFEAGVLEVLKEKGVVPDLICGASAGALNAAGKFYQQIGEENQQLVPPEHPDNSFIARLWRFIGRNNDGAKYVLDKPRLITIISKDVMGQKKRNPLVLFTILMELLGSLPILLLMAGVTLFLLVSILILWQFFSPLDPKIAAITGPSLFISTLSILVGTVFVAHQMINARSIFNNARLYATLFNSSKGGDLNSLKAVLPEAIEKRAEEIVEEWYQKIDQDEIPEFIVTTTNLTNKSGMLFSLAQKETYIRLIRDEWYVIQLLDRGGEASPFFREIAQSSTLSRFEKSHALFADGTRLLKSILSSTSIPVVFPSQELEIYDSKGKSGAKTNHFTDGGVLNNSPIQVAIAAGATHIISIELEDLRFIPFDEIPDEKGKNRSYSMMDTLTRTFFTLLTNATSEDVARSANWNKALVQNEQIKDRRLVQLYRIAPILPDEDIKKPIGVIDFNGSFENGKRVTTLADWMNFGKKIASKKAFWRATLEVYPTELPQ